MQMNEKTVILRGDETKVVEFFETLPAGQIHTILVVNDLDVPKKHEGNKLKKVTKMQVRMGEYANQKRVIEKRANEPDGTIHKLPYELNEEVENRIYTTKNGNVLVRFLPVHNGNHCTIYLENGKIKPLEELKGKYSDSTLRINKKEPTDCLSISARKIFAVC